MRKALASAAAAFALVFFSLLTAPGAASADDGAFTSPTVYSGLKITPELQPTGSIPEVVMSNTDAYGEWRGYDTNTRLEYASQGFFDDPSESKFLMEILSPDDTVDVVWDQVGTYYGEPIGAKMHVSFDDTENVLNALSPFSRGDDTSTKLNSVIVIPNMFCDLNYLHNADPARYSIEFFFTNDETRTPIDVDLAYMTMRDMDGSASEDRYQYIIPNEGWTGEAYKVDGALVGAAELEGGKTAFYGMTYADGTAQSDVISVSLSFSGTIMGFDVCDTVSDNVYRLDFAPIVEPTDVPVRFVLNGDIENPVHSSTIKADSDLTAADPSIAAATMAAQAAEPGAYLSGWYVDPELTVPFTGMHVTAEPIVLYAESTRPNATKTIAPSESGIDEYDLSLSVEGADWSAKQPTDILFVIDQTGSMSTNLDRILQAVERASTRLVEAGEGNTRIAVGAYSSYDSDGINDVVIPLSSDPDYSLLDTVELTTLGGTSWFTGYDVAEKLAAQTELDRDAYLVFLSDGEPNYNEEGVHDASDVGALEAAVADKFNALLGANGNIELIVSSLGNLPMMQKLASDTESDYIYDATADGLASKIEAQLAARTLAGSAESATITDALSEDVGPVSTDGKGRPLASVFFDGVAGVEGTDYSYEYDANTRTMTFTALRQIGAGHHMTATVSIRPADGAYKEMQGGAGYPDIGDEGTGDTSAGREGYASNESGSASWENPLDGGTASVRLPVPVVQISSPSISLSKEAVSASGAYRAGDAVEFLLTATNDGVLPLTGVSFADALDGAEICDVSFPDESGRLEPGETATARVRYEISQDDVSVGRVDNSASVSAYAERGGGKVEDGDDASIAIEPAPSISLVKGADRQSVSAAAAGDTVEWTFTVSNDGNTALEGVSLDDAMLGGDVSGSLSDTSLLPGETATASIGYRLTQADIDRGYVENSATASGAPVADGWDGGRVSASDESKVDLPEAPALSVDKAADRSEISAAKPGDSIEYTLTVTNTGNTTASDVSLDDPLVGGDLTASLGKTSLEPGESVETTATYEITQADIDRGRVDNTATARGTSPTGTEIEATGDSSVGIVRTPSISLSKEAIGGTLISGAAPGDVVSFSIAIENTGNVTLTVVAVEELLENAEIDASGMKDALAPGERTECTASYALTQEDIDRGDVLNIARATATAPDGSEVSDDGEAGVSVESSPSLALDKASDAERIELAEPGDIVVFHLTATNTGNTTLTGVAIDDPMLGGDLSGMLADRTLAPGESVDISIEYAVTQTDIDAGHVRNEAKASASDPHGAIVEDEAEAAVDLPYSPSLRLEKEASVEGAGGDGEPGRIDEAGDKIVYSFSITNTGNVTLNGLRVEDAMLGGDIPLDGAVYAEADGEEASDLAAEKTTGTDAPSSSANGDAAEEADAAHAHGSAFDGTIAPGETIVVEIGYETVQEDIDRGSIVNEATAYAQSPSGENADGEAIVPAEVSDDDDAIAEADRRPSMSMTKTPDRSVVENASAGDRIGWTISIENDGNVTLEGIELEDRLEGVELDASALDGVSLAPGETVSIVAAYLVTDADIEAGSVVNTADAIATATGGEKVSAHAESEVSIAKSAGVAGMLLSQTGANGIVAAAAAAMAIVAASAISAAICLRARSGSVDKRRR